MGGNYPSKIAAHSNTFIGDHVFVWGGRRPGIIPLVHDSPDKTLITSSVDVYSILNGSFVTRPTTGSPPNATLYYSCCSIGNDIYYFGGSCKVNDCYHDNLLVLNTTGNNWREIDSNNGPIRKNGCGMIPFIINDDDYLLVIGGGGACPVPVINTTPYYSQYIPIPNNPSRCFTNEVHIMCISSTPGKWTVPLKSGYVFPPSAYLSINKLPGNRAILFGGVTVIDGMIHFSNDVFIISFTNKSVDYQRISKPLQPNSIQWPIGRSGHSSVVISSVSSDGVKKHYLLILGGWDGTNITSDCWIMNTENNKWTQISLPVTVSKRFRHSMTSYMMSMNCVWLLITGGYNTASAYVTGANIMNIELVFSPTTNEWTVTNIMNCDDIKNNGVYAKLVLNCLSEFSREYQRTEIQSVTEDIIRQQREISIQMTELRQQHQQEMTTLQEQKDRQIMEKDRQIMEKDRQKDKEITTLREEKEQQIMEKDQQIMTKDGQIMAKDGQIMAKDGQIMEKDRQIMEKDRQRDNEINTLREEKDRQIMEKDQQIMEKDLQIMQKDGQIMVKDGQIRERNEIIGAKNDIIQQQQTELQSQPWILQRDEVEITNEKIGGGAYGEVRIAIFRGTRVAAKLLHDMIISRRNKNVFKKEMGISSRVHHPNIVQFIGATRIDNPILLYELMATSLYDRLQDDQSLTRPHIIGISIDISSALAYFHNWRPHPIIHRDVSSPNILMEPLSNDKWRCKLSDLGSARMQLDANTAFPGNVAYSSPEASNPSFHTPKMDIYSMGILMTEITLHQAPDIIAERRLQQANSINWILMKHIILQCINTDYTNRIPALLLLEQLKQL